MRIVKRKASRKKYFYLQHSFRKKGKVITKERYLGLKIPNNIEKIKLLFIREIKQETNKKIEAIKNNFQKEWSRIPENARKKELEEMSIAFTYNTNAIEGSAITLAEAREIIQNKISPHKPLRDVKETEAHSEVFLEMLNKKEKLNKNLLLKWHRNIFEKTKPDITGKFREYLVRVGSYVAPDWRDIKKLVGELLNFIKNSEKINYVELSARAHYRFEKIHPLGDGNGRIGRLLMNYILWHKGYPILIIEHKKRKSYYKALQKDEEGFVSYFIRKYLTVHKKYFLQ